MMHQHFFILYAVASLPFLKSDIPYWVLAASFLFLGYAYAAYKSYVSSLKPWTLAVVTIVSVAAVYWEYKTLLGPEPAASLLLLMAALKLHEVRSARDRIIFLFIIILIVMYFLLFFQTIFSTIYMLALCLAVMVSFITIHTPQERRKQVFSSAPKLVAKDLLLAAPIFIILFAFFPRFTTPWASLLGNDSQQIGFSENLNPGEMANLAKSLDPAFRVTFVNAKQLNPKDYYWRGIVLEKTDGWNWDINDGKKNLPQEFNSKANNNTNYTITIEAKFRKNLFVLDSTSALRWNESKMFNPILQLSGRSYKTVYPLVSRTIYHGASESGKTWKEALAQQDLILQKSIQKQSNRATDFANELAKESQGSAIKMSQLIMEYYTKNNFIYSLSTPEMKTLDDFLFKNKVGFCEHFAAATASLMRIAGFPARVVMGFQGGEWNDLGDYLLVRDQHAHAWIEIYENGQWLRIDPTGAVNSIRIEMGSLNEAIPGLKTAGNSRLSKMYYELALAYDAIENRYNQFLMNYNLDAQIQIFKLNGSALKNRLVMFAYAVGLSSVIYFLIYLYSKRRPKQSRADRMLDNLKSQLRARKVEVHISDGPIDLVKKAIELNPQNREKIISEFEKWLEYRYGKMAFLEPSDSEILKCEKVLFREINRRFDDVKNQHTMNTLI